MTNAEKLERLFNNLFLVPIRRKQRKDYRNAWDIREEQDLCKILESMQWINEELHDISSHVSVGFAEIHYGEKRYWPVPLLTSQPLARLAFLADYIGREGKKKIPCVAFAGAPLDPLSELFFYYLKDCPIFLRELGFWHTKPYLRRQPERFDISRVNGDINRVIGLLREKYDPQMHNCVRVAFMSGESERDVTFAELNDGTMVCGYVPFDFLQRTIQPEPRGTNIY